MNKLQTSDRCAGQLKSNLLSRTVLSGLLFTMFLSQGCNYKRGEINAEEPNGEVTKREISTKYERSGELKAMLGETCVEVQHNPGGPYGDLGPVVVFESEPLPGYATDATVILSGFEHRYLHDDQELLGIGAGIDNVEVIDAPGVAGKILHWTVSGGIGDSGFDNAYRTCYHYTLLAWNAGEIDARVLQSDDLVVSHTGVRGLQRRGGETNDTRLIPGEAVVAAPLGFGVFLGDSSAIEQFIRVYLGDQIASLAEPVVAALESVAMRVNLDGDAPSSSTYTSKEIATPAVDDARHNVFGIGDHHLLQIAYEVGAAGSVVETNAEGDPFVDWESTFIYTDDSDTRRYSVAEQIVLLTGTGVRLKAASPIILQRKASQPCNVGPNARIISKSKVVRDLDFEHAVPLLKAWDVGYVCDDEHVERVGVWLDDFSYTVNPATDKGTLRYVVKSILHENNADRGNYLNYEVAVLGFNTYDRTNGWYVSDQGAYVPELINEMQQAWTLGHGDFNGDGREDIFQATHGRWYVSYGGEGPWQRLAKSDFELPDLAFGDFDCDGRSDVFRTSGGNWWMSSAGVGSWQRLNTSGFTLSNIALGDFDGDGCTDVLRTNGAHWYVSWGATEPWQVLRSGASETIPTLALADIDGDGSTDILRTTRRGRLGRWEVSYGGSSGWQFLVHSQARVTDFQFGDFTGDGKDDGFRIQAPDPRRWTMYVGFSRRFVVWNQFGMTGDHVFVADFDGDARADVFVSAR